MSPAATLETSGAQAQQPADGDLLAGVDVGGTIISVIITTLGLEVVGRYDRPTVAGRPDEAGEQIAGAVREACSSAGVSIDRIVALGVGVPGRVDPEEGSVTLALNLGWRSVDVRDQVEAALGVPTMIDNDVRAAAQGLATREVLGPVQDLAYISIGTGIAAGIVLDGRLHRGTRGLAGEIGHVMVEPDGEVCACGRRGCLETVASGPAVARRARGRIEGGRASSLASQPTFSAREVYAAAREGDALATEVVEEAGAQLGRIIYDLALTLDVQAICLGGGVTNAGPPFLAPISRELDRLRSASDLAAEALPEDLVHLLPVDSDPGPWGALMLARKGRTSRSVRDQDRKEVSGRSVQSSLTA